MKKVPNLDVADCDEKIKRKRKSGRLMFVYAILSKSAAHYDTSCNYLSNEKQDSLVCRVCNLSENGNQILKIHESGVK